VTEIVKQMTILAVNCPHQL